MSSEPQTTIPAGWRITEIRIDASNGCESMSRGTRCPLGLEPNEAFAEILADVLTSVKGWRYLDARHLNTPADTPAHGSTAVATHTAPAAACGT